VYKKLRILFTILAACCVAAILPIGTLFGFGFAGLCIVLAFLFAGLMLLCKQNQELDERKNQREEEKRTDKQDEKEEI